MSVVRFRPWPPFFQIGRLPHPVLQRPGKVDAEPKYVPRCGFRVVGSASIAWIFSKLRTRRGDPPAG